MSQKKFKKIGEKLFYPPKNVLTLFPVNCGFQSQSNEVKNVLLLGRTHLKVSSLAHPLHGADDHDDEEDEESDTGRVGQAADHAKQAGPGSEGPVPEIVGRSGRIGGRERAQRDSVRYQSPSGIWNHIDG